MSVAGEFNDWSLDANPMVVDGEQARCEIALLDGRSYRFRYVIGGERWENDWQADRYETNEFGGEDSVVDLTDVQLPETKAKVDAPTTAPKRRRTKRSETSTKADA